MTGLSWNLADLRHCLDSGRIQWRKHALERMLERGISRAEVLASLRQGEIIASYPEDRPIPSALLHANQEPPLHVVAALDKASATCYVITCYRPDAEHFGPDLKTRIKP
ncbi:DUF4258 domain-containing protein [Magnetovirga frankeli]|uniref:DUF4258 domain-containing protein n=1 Tax=Magnetovirga frankeli TaxID=947516 RepID=UPI001292EFF5|nr:DUF4258 domain-containing protein [gamma proteobacterium SS-5]